MAQEARNRRYALYAGLGVAGLYAASRIGGASGPGGGNGDTSVGGGDYYTDTPTRGQANYVASTRSELADALSAAVSGEIVFVDGDIHTSDTFYVPAGVTLASGRGTSDTTGRIVCDSPGFVALGVDPDARVTGLVVEGYETGYRRNNAFLDDEDVPNSWITWIGGTGISMNGSGIRIDNCEVFGHERGFSDAGGNLIEHCDIHHMLQGGTGYGIYADDGTEIRRCTFDYNRHSVASGGNVSYHAHHNWAGPNHVGHVFDHHGISGGPEFNGTVEINNNVVEQFIRAKTLPGYNGEPVGVRGAESPAATLNMRGIPQPAAEVHHNWTYHEEGPFPGDTPFCIGEGGDYHSPAINQWDNDAYMEPSCDSYHNMNVYSNHYGSSEPTDPSIGL